VCYTVVLSFIILFVCLDSKPIIDALELKAELKSPNASKRPIPISTQEMKKEFAAKIRRTNSNNVSFSM